MNLSSPALQAIKEEVLRCYPVEMCGLVVEGSFIACTNVHEDALNNFRIETEEFAQYVGKIDAIVHSHTAKQGLIYNYDIRTPSMNDVAMQKQVGVPFLIFGTNGSYVMEQVEYPKPFSNNYIGRPWMWFIHDCYSIVRDYYYFEKGVTLGEHKAIDLLNPFTALRTSYVHLLEEVGFSLQEPRDFVEGDILLMNSRLGGRKNHLGIVMDKGILHQLEMSVVHPMENFIGRVEGKLSYASYSN